MREIRFEDMHLFVRVTDLGSLSAVARESMRRKAGARGLRAILENVMLDTMYDLPSQSNVKECIVSEDVILDKARPIMVYGAQAETA